MEMQPKPKNYLVESILVTVFCCLPLGIVAIVNASAVNGAYENGNYAEAEQKSADAKKWMTWGLIAGAVGIALYVIFFVLVGIGGGLAA